LEYFLSDACTSISEEGKVVILLGQLLANKFDKAIMSNKFFSMLLKDINLEEGTLEMRQVLSLGKEGRCNFRKAFVAKIVSQPLVPFRHSRVPLTIQTSFDPQFLGKLINGQSCFLFFLACD
jgi:hypothetical protein